MRLAETMQAPEEPADLEQLGSAGGGRIQRLAGQPGIAGASRGGAIARENGVPKVEVKDPSEAHKKMALALDDPQNKNLHDVTAYLATLK